MIVDTRIGSHFLTDTITAVSETTVVVEHLDSSKTVPLRAVVWVETPTKTGFESGLTDDPTVADYRQIDERETKHKYAVEYAPDTCDVSLYDTLVDVGATVPFSRRTSGDRKWLSRVSVPDRETFATYGEKCEDVGMELSVESVQEASSADPQAGYGLTAKQHEALLVAVKNGHLSVPREQTVSELADELGISRQAASERLRRGYRHLIRNTLIGADEPAVD